MKSISLLFPDGRKVALAKGQTLAHVAREFNRDFPDLILAATLDRRLVSLDTAPDADAQVEFVTYRSRMGQEIYQRTAAFLLNMAVVELYHNTRLVIGHSLASGIYYDFYTAVPVTQDLLDGIAAKMREIAGRNLPLQHRIMNRERAIAFIAERAMSDSLRLAEHSPLEEIQIYEGGRFANIEMYPLAPTTGVVSRFALKTYSPGFVLLFPDPADFSLNTNIGKTRKLFQIYRESIEWGKILGVNDVGRLNQVVAAGGVSEIIKVAESLHEKKIARIADTVSDQQEDVRLVLIAGPSASGKTTFSKRLATQLKVNGVRPIALSLDNYFVDRESCPRDEHGEFDFESLAAVDLGLFNSQLADLLEGREVSVPRFDFESGRRESDYRQLRLEDDQILMVEGIHALNPKVSETVAEAHKFKIYISALTQLTIDEHSRISTTDTRLLRRLVRDHNYRGYQPGETLRRFPSVIRGERRNTFPFQENADVMFNSALAYELAVLKEFAVPLLETIAHDDAAFPDARRLLTFLKLFQPVAADEIPPTSILREFIGGSSFKY